MSANTLQIRLALSGLAEVRAGMASLTTTVSNGFASIRAAAGTATMALAAMAGIGGFGAMIRRGVEFNASLEQITLGIAAVQKQLRPDAFKTFDDAMVSATYALDLLKRKARESDATLADLQQGFLGLTGPATAAGMSLEKQVDLITVMSIALPKLGIREEQLLQESRALVTGTINHNAAAARMLNITHADIAKATAEGKLYDFLMEKLAAFGEAGKRGSQTFSVAASNMKDVLDQTLAAATERITQFATVAALRWTKWLDTSDIGPRVDAWIGAAADAFDKGRLTDFLALTIEAGFEQGFEAARKVASGFFEWLGSDGWRPLLYGVVAMTTAITDGIARALIAVETPIAAFGMMLADALREGSERAWDAFKKYGSEAINFVGELLERLVSAFNRIANFASGGLIQAPDITIPRVAPDRTEIRESLTWSEALAKAEKERETSSAAISEHFAETRRSARELLEIDRQGRAEVDGRVSATERLGEIMDGFKKAKPAPVAPPAIKPGLAPFDMDAFERQSEQNLQRIRRERALVEGSFALTNEEKYSLRLKSIAEERMELERIVEALRERALIETDASAKEQQMTRVDGFSKQVSQLDVAESNAGADPASFRENMLATIVDIEDAFGTAAQSVARAFRGVIGSAVDGIANSIGGLIRGTMTWGEALQNIGSSVLNGVIDSISRMFAEWIVKMTLIRGLESLFSTQRKAETASELPGNVANSAASAGGSWGVSSIIGLAAFMALIGAAIALGGAFAEGGRPPLGVPSLVGERGPELFVPDRPGTVINADTTASILASASSQGRDDAGLGGSQQSVNVAMFDSRLDARRWAESSEGEAWFVDMARRTQHRFTRA